MVVPVFELLSCKVIKSRLLFKKIANFKGKILKFSEYFGDMEAVIYWCFFNLHDCTFKCEVITNNKLYDKLPI